MVFIEFLGPIDKEPIELEVSSLAELSKVLFKDEIVRPWLDNCAVAINDEIVKDFDYKLKDGDRVSLLPPVCGG